MKNEYNVNDQIRSSKINLVLSDGTMREGIPLKEALSIAEEEGLDVVEVSGKEGGISICKLMDYGKLMYDRGKKNKKNQKKHSHLKEMRYGVNIDEHDLKIKHDKIFKFLAKKYSVRYVMELKGREKYSLDEAVRKMTKNLDNFRDVSQWKDPEISKNGSRISISTILHQI